MGGMMVLVSKFFLKKIKSPSFAGPFTDWETPQSIFYYKYSKLESAVNGGDGDKF